MYDAYICCRRLSGDATALLVSRALTEKGISCFFDADNLPFCYFPESLARAIKNSRNFLLVLTPNSMAACDRENDWMTEEISIALTHKIPIIPITCKGFSWPVDLPMKIREILYYNALVLDTEHFNPFLDRLVTFLGLEKTAVSSDLVGQPPRTVPEDAYVFISYSTKDSDTARQTRRILETNGIRCWMAPESIPGGSDYGEEIPQAIEGCKALLLLLSQASQASQWVPKEVGLGIGQGKVIVPFQIDDGGITSAFNFYLTNSQRISAYNRMAEAYQELVKRLLDILCQE